MKAIYATILTTSFLPRALALFQSVRRYNQTAGFSFFCVDDESAACLRSLDLVGCKIYQESDYADDTLRTLRNKRTISEYCWTTKPYAICHLLESERAADWVAYLDSDMLAFNDLDEAIIQAANGDFLLAPHRFSESFQVFSSSAGLYNAGYVAFRASTLGRAAAARWRDLCIESCPAIPTADSYADQRHLERLRTEFPTGGESCHVGLNAAPWNIARYRVTNSNGAVLLNESPLLLYHFQALKILCSRWVELYDGEVKLCSEVCENIYVPYLNALANAYAELARVTTVTNLGEYNRPRGTLNWLAYTKKVLSGRTNLRRCRLWH